MDFQIVSIILACVGPLLTLLVYQWKQGRENNRLMAQMGLLFYDHSVMNKLILHLAMDDPKFAAEERTMLEKRITKIEGVLKLLVSKGRLEKLLEDEVETLGKN